MNTSPDINFNPIISSIQKVAVYETKQRLYLIGSNYKESRFRILEVDRTCVDELRIFENPKEFDNQEIRQFVNKIRYTKCLGAYGVLGFVRFLEGYYIVLITKRIRCAAIGMHTIYTVKDTIMIRITDGSVPRTLHQHEARYVKMFCNIDLKSNFYFCYSYDLTRSLQHNMSGPKFVGHDVDVETEEPLPDWSQMNLGPGGGHSRQKVEFAFRSVSRKRFVWNEFLLKPLQHIHHRDWCLEVITGFVGQSSINIYGRPIYVCLVARRSTKFAGTRFLKRGANRNGDVANEVETEQIVTDGNRMCSFVQMRGSIPSHWSQDTSKIVSKPPISLDLSDPYAETAGKHFERLLYDYGAPVIVFNLVKKREKRKHESILTQDMLTSIRYLNQFVPVPFKIKYVAFDMARKSRGQRVIMSDLARIAESIIQSTGMYLHDPQGQRKNSFQTGLVRVNCVDCLDRTNTAQFAIGKCVLAHQLHQLGFINPPLLEFDSDCVTMLESLYEDHGDTLALQYGGSQLVHRIKSYRKTAAWSSQGNDIMQTMSRYVSNKFSDAEKQHSINLFLGYFVPYENQTNQNLAIWDLPSDYYMHNLLVTGAEEQETDKKKKLRPMTDWIREIVLKNLPNSTSDSCKIVSEFIRVQSHHVEMVDCYSNYYVPNRYTAFEEQIAYQIKLLASPNFRMNPYNDYSPFVPRKREVITTNPSLTGQSSTSSATGSTSSSCDEDQSSDDETQLAEVPSTVEYLTMRKRITFNSVIGSMQDVYGMDLKKPTRESQRIYRAYVQVGREAKGLEEKTGQAENVRLKGAPIKSQFKPKDYKNLLNPHVNSGDMLKYSNYLLVPEKFATKTLEVNHDLLTRYLNVQIG